MKGKYKTKNQLKDELVKLRHRIGELEKLQPHLKRTEETLRNTEEEKIAIIDTMLEHVVYRDTNMRILWANRAAGESVGLAPEQLVGRYCYEIWHQRSIPCVVCPAKESLKTGQPQKAEVTTPDGRIWFIRTYPIRDANGSIMGIANLTLEITEHKRAEEALEKALADWQSTFNSTEDLIMLLDKEFKIIKANLPTSRFLGLAINEIPGKNCFQLFHGTEAPPDICPFKKMKQTKKHEEAEMYLDERSIWIDVSCDPVFDGKGNLTGAVHIIKNITKRKLAEKEKESLQAQLVQSAKMAGIGTLASGISHEFNNILQIMIGHIQFAQRTKHLEDIGKAFNKVLDASDRATKIIKDLLDFSRPNVLRKALCDIIEPIESVLLLTEEQLKKHNIEVVRKYGRIPQIKVNRGEMQQVFLNMVTNARDAMLPKGGKLEIRIKQVKKNVEVSFNDTGKGIKKENLDRVFEPFYTTKGAVGGRSDIFGTGLGLSVSYGIVKRHGGTIEVESDVGKGTTFTVKLPVKAVRTQKRSEKKREVKKTKVLNILIVDDEEEICTMFTKWLSAERHRVKSALTGRRAINLIKKENFDIVFLDIVMPGIPSVEVLDKIKEISPKTRIIMITGKFIDEDLLKNLRQKGASEFL